LFVENTTNGVKMKTYILWHGWNGKPTYQGVVGGAFWDNFPKSAAAGKGNCYLIDADSVATAKALLPSTKQSPVCGVFTYGDSAAAALEKLLKV
jgi:hypothetical protein